MQRLHCCAAEKHHDSHDDSTHLLHTLTHTFVLLQEYWLPINALTAIMFPIIAFFEITRLQGFAKTGKVSTF